MRQHRIIRSYVASALEAVLAKNKQRYTALESDKYIPSPYSPSLYERWMNERWCYPITLPSGKEITIEIRGDRIITDIATLPDECYDAVLSMPEVFEAVAKERTHQDEKWGPNKPQSLPGFLLVLEQELNEAKLAWAKNVTGEHATLNEIVQIAATAVACLEKYGVSGSTIATNDIPETQR